jgi:hypothetical protein|tara:strand:+ start:21666 stop:21791 length:126 start_codon:yes stop_codon:yes gene_type:complete
MWLKVLRRGRAEGTVAPIDFVFDVVAHVSLLEGRGVEMTWD